jgi:Malectin domain
MKTEKSLLYRLNIISAAALAALVIAGCQSSPQESKNESAPSTAGITNALAAAPDAATPATAPATNAEAAAPVAAAPAEPAAPAATTEPAQLVPPIRIKAGATEGFTDSDGNKWLPDQGFADGETVERPDIAITNTQEPRIYRAEHYSMTSFTQALPNGKYIVKLHFCETYDGITGPGQRVFTFNVAGHEFKDFDVWAKSGGLQTAYVETVPVEITNGKLEITFTPNIENPQINGIEILPAD